MNDSFVLEKKEKETSIFNIKAKKYLSFNISYNEIKFLLRFSHFSLLVFFFF